MCVRPSVDIDARNQVSRTLTCFVVHDDESLNEWCCWDCPRHS